MEHALPFRRCVTGDIFTITGEDAEAFVAECDKYLAVFAAPATGEDGKPCCFHCGEPVDGFKQALGMGVAYRWGLAHGEATCSGCGWPARGMHYPKGDDGEELFSLRNFFLAYHPDEVTERKPASAIEARQGQDCEAGLIGEADESAAPKADAQ